MKWPELGPELGYRLHYVSTANLEEFTSNGSAYFKFDVGSLYLSTDIIRLLASCPRPLIEPALNHLLSLLFGRRTMRHCRFRLRITRIVMLRWALCLQREGRAERAAINVRSAIGEQHHRKRFQSKIFRPSTFRGAARWSVLPWPGPSLEQSLQLYIEVILPLDDLQRVLALPSQSQRSGYFSTFRHPLR